MGRIACCIVLSVLAALSTGCAMCSSCHDDEYSAYGGTWERHDAARGRVGSAFYNAGGPTMAPAAPETVAPPESPQPNDAPPQDEAEPMPETEPAPPPPQTARRSKAR